jgi:ectoine hydroxylase-related dioxygenase (phytanoyl-CoA dioxygenase family)
VLSNYRLLFSNFIVKEPFADTKVNIHQDWNFTSPDHVSINIWIPLTDITASTGLFYALKGSHRSFQNIRYTPMAPDTYTDIENYIKEKSTAFQVKAGYALIYHGALVHYSGSNISGSVRMAVGGALIPAAAPNLHYYKRWGKGQAIEIYEVDNNFYHGFDFYQEPKGVNKIGELASSPALPSLNDLVRN